jgi:hypothetical protein
VLLTYLEYNTGDLDWIAALITDNSCIVAVMDGLYMKEMYPYLSSVAFVVECSKGWGQLMGTFVEYTSDAASYCRELLGLKAIHLILLGINIVSQGLQGSVHIWLDCLGALDKVKNLMPYLIPSQCSHSHLLKNIMINGSNLSFTHIFFHVKAHQDNHTGYKNLTCSAQLNCQMEYHAKKGHLGHRP